MLIPMQAGGESLERVELLFKLTKLGENTKRALVAHFVEGQSVALAAVGNVQEPNLARAIKCLNEVNDIVENIKHLDLYHLTDKKIHIGGLHETR